MAVVAVKSTVITNRDNTPRVHNNDYIEKGLMRESVATVSVTTGDTSTSTYRLLTLPSNARLSVLQIFTDDMGSLTTIDFGLWDTTDNGGASVSPTLFASAYIVNAGALDSKNILFSTLSATNIEKRVWELLGLSADPIKDYDLVARLAATADAGGNLAVKVTFTL